VSAFTMPSAMTARIADVARESGTELLEAGGFILGPVGGERATVLALTGEKGIDRSWALFQVSGLAVATLFDWADDHELRIFAQWHSHRFEAFLSKTDLHYGFNVPGFRSAIVPYYEQPSSTPADWGWWIYNEALWAQTAAPVLDDADFSTITFEEGHIYEH
jgi:hypothetical protein